MQFIANIYALVALATVVIAIPASAVSDASEANTVESGYLVSHEAMMHWITTTDAELTFIGDPPNPLTPRAAQNTMVTYCSSRTQNVCGGRCTVYNGGAACLNAPNTNCLGATNNVGFCDRGGCGGSCNQLSSCGTRLDNGFCFTPGTASIIVSSA